MALKNNIGVHYFACLIPMHVLFVEDGLMEKGVFLATWKDISSENEKQFEIHTGVTDAGNNFRVYFWLLLSEILSSHSVETQ